MNQNKRLLTYLEQGQTINPLKAWNELGIYRLASRVCDLRKQGIEIKDRWWSEYTLNRAVFNIGINYPF